MPGAGQTTRTEKREEGAARAETHGGTRTSETPERKAQQRAETPKAEADHADKIRNGSAEAGRPSAPQARPNPGGAGKAAATGKVSCPQEKASQIVETLTRTTMSSNVNVAMNIGVAISVGATIRANVTLTPLTPEVVALAREFRGYDHVIAQDEIIIVEPSTRRVVEIIQEAGNLASQPAPARAAGITLTETQQQLLVQTVRTENLAPAQVPDLADGVTSRRAWSSRRCRKQ